MYVDSRNRESERRLAHARERVLRNSKRTVRERKPEQWSEVIGGTMHCISIAHTVTPVQKHTHNTHTWNEVKTPLAEALYSQHVLGTGAEVN